MRVVGFALAAIAQSFASEDACAYLCCGAETLSVGAQASTVDLTTSSFLLSGHNAPTVAMARGCVAPIIPKKVAHQGTVCVAATCAAYAEPNCNRVQTVGNNSAITTPASANARPPLAHFFNSSIVLFYNKNYVCK